MPIGNVRIKKLEIYGDHFYVVLLTEPTLEDVQSLQYYLGKKNVAKVTFEHDGKIVESQLERLDKSLFMTDSNEVYSYR